MTTANKMIHEKPLLGLPAIHVGSRIVVWNHHDDKIAFVGKITRILNLEEAIGENYVVDTKNNGRLTKTTRLNLFNIGLVPLSVENGRLTPWFRTYALPYELAPAEYAKFRVTYKAPAQIRQKEEEAKEKARVRLGITLVDI